MQSDGNKPPLDLCLWLHKTSSIFNLKFWTQTTKRSNPTNVCLNWTLKVKSTFRESIRTVDSQQILVFFLSSSCTSIVRLQGILPSLEANFDSNDTCCGSGKTYPWHILHNSHTSIKQSIITKNTTRFQVAQQMCIRPQKTDFVCSSFFISLGFSKCANLRIIFLKLRGRLIWNLYFSIFKPF